MNEVEKQMLIGINLLVSTNNNISRDIRENFIENTRKLLHPKEEQSLPEKTKNALRGKRE